MANYKTSYLKITKGETVLELISKEELSRFTEDILGLGEIDKKSNQVNALCVIFDLEGFTNFCKQIDPQLAVPEYLSLFLKWIFNEIRTEVIDVEHEEGYEMFYDLPCMTKYLGDGVLFIWDTENMDEVAITNVVPSMYEICNKYQDEFLPSISKKTSSPPPKLRCGIARGAIYSVGDGVDFVGPCINMAARLQKLNNLTLCFSRRGINPDILGSDYKDLFLVKKVDIRGIGSEELVCVLESEYEKLEQIDKNKFVDI